jgi:hypothetical protein
VKTNKYRPPLFYFIFRPSLVDDLKFISFVWNTQKPKPKTCSLYLYSEKFLVKVLKEGFSSYIGKANHSATLFTVRPHLFHPPEICIFDRKEILFLFLFYFLGTGKRRFEKGSLFGRPSHPTWPATLHRVVQEAAQSDVPAPPRRRRLAFGRVAGRRRRIRHPGRRGRKRISSEIVPERRERLRTLAARIGGQEIHQ